MKRRLALGLCCGLLLASSLHADPMRPLTSAAEAPAAASASAGTVGRSPAAPDSPRQTGPAETLWAVRQDSQGDWSALLGERWLKVGQRVEQGLVSQINQHGVQLRRGPQLVTLNLLPTLQTSPPALKPPSPPSSPQRSAHLQSPHSP